MSWGALRVEHAGVVCEDVPPYERTTFSRADVLEGRLPASVARDCFDDREERAELAKFVHAGLMALARLDARAELEIGRGLGRLTREFDTIQLGIPRFGDFCLGHYRFSGSHGKQLRLMSERLEHLPRLRAAFLSGRVPRTKLRAVLAAATPETDAAWAYAASRHSVRTLERAARDCRRKDKGLRTPSASAEDSPELVTLRWLASPLDALLFQHHGRELVCRVLGREVADGVVLEALLQEAESERDLPPSEEGDASRASRTEKAAVARISPLPRSTGAIAKLARGLLREVARRRAHEQEATETAAPADPSPADALAVELPSVEAGTCIEEVDAAVAELVSIRWRIQWERSRLLRTAFVRALWEPLGFARWDLYLEHGLGMSEREARELIEREGRLEELPKLAAALREGALSPRAVDLLHRVATPDTEADWLEAGRTYTDKRLCAEVPHHLMLRVTLERAEYLEATDRGRPMPFMSMADLNAGWRSVLGPEPQHRRTRRKGQPRPPSLAAAFAARLSAVPQRPSAELRRPCGEQRRAWRGARISLGRRRAGWRGDTSLERQAGPERPVGPEVEKTDEQRREEAQAMSVGASRRVRAALVGTGLNSRLLAGDRVVTVRVPADVAEHFHDVVERIKLLHDGRIDDGQCVTWMLLRFAQVWCGDEVEKILRDYPIFERDGWQCTAPHCRSVAQLEDHHVVFRGRGGSKQARTNRTSQCWANHHGGIHGGWVVVEGEAPYGLVFHVGRGRWRKRYRNEIRLA